MLHRFSKFLAACTVLLILAGSLVTSHDAGLSVPDWPTSYGWNMFTFPPSMWVANIFYEHGHRLIASSVGFLTIVLALWLWIADPRPWLRWFGVAALGAVIAQGLLGGLTVIYFLPPAVSTAHAGLAEIFFCMTVAVALFTSPGWNSTTPSVDDRRLRLLATATTVAIYCQILIGATMRHTGAGLAIPDFPLMFGRLVPDHWNPGIAIHFTHRVGALVVAAMAIGTSSYIWRRHTDHVELAQPALLILIFIVLQTTLGALTVLTRRQPWINSLHVVGGALVLTTSLVITLRSWRVRIGDWGLRIADWGLRIEDWGLRIEDSTADSIADSTADSRASGALENGKPILDPHTPIPSPHTPIPSPHTPIPNPHTPIPNPHTPIPNPHTPISNPHTPISNPHTPIRNPQSTIRNVDAPRARA